jgi:purine-cytosine permease-like protein
LRVFVIILAASGIVGVLAAILGYDFTALLHRAAVNLVAIGSVLSLVLLMYRSLLLEWRTIRRGQATRARQKKQ